MPPIIPVTVKTIKSPKKLHFDSNLADTATKFNEATTTEISNIDDMIFMFERKNPLMEHMLLPNTYVIKKKANYLERIFCSLLAFDNVYKLFIWNEELVESGPRLLRYS